MTWWKQIARLVKDPPPSHVFELSEAGLAFAHGGLAGFEPFPFGTLQVSPVEDNILRPEAIAWVMERVAPANGSKKRRPAAVVLPDYTARVTVLDFDSFPSVPEEQLALIRFRVKKTVPFDIDSAAVSYHVQPASPGKAGEKKIEVIAVTVALEVIARYEALFRNAGFHPGVITTSALAALSMYRGDGVAVFAKLAGRVLTVAVLAQNTIKLFRCVTLEEPDEDEIRAVLHPTFAYVEDELGSPARKLIVCGFPQGTPVGIDCEIEFLSGHFGVPGPFDAGLLGCLEAVEN
jgi:type IV pilus assembly protein PilM